MAEIRGVCTRGLKEGMVLPWKQQVWGAYAIGVTWTQKPTPAPPSLWSATVLGWYGTPGGCAGMQAEITHRSHAQNHTRRPPEAATPAYGAVWRVGHIAPLSLPSNTNVEGFLSAAIKKMIKQSKKSPEQNKSAAREQGGN